MLSPRRVTNLCALVRASNMAATKGDVTKLKNDASRLCSILYYQCAWRYNLLRTFNFDDTPKVTTTRTIFGSRL